MVSNGFAANSGFARINGWRKRSAFLHINPKKKKLIKATKDEGKSPKKKKERKNK
jgi:hypothetical protein